VKKYQVQVAIFSLLWHTKTDSHQKIGILVSEGCSTQETNRNQQKPKKLDILKLMSDFSETYATIGCQAAMEMETYEI
jgi:hypothetical protein